VFLEANSIPWERHCQRIHLTQRDPVEVRESPVIQVWPLVWFWWRGSAVIVRLAGK
jgi:hypothetical protein